MHTPSSWVNKARGRVQGPPPSPFLGELILDSSAVSHSSGFADRYLGYGKRSLPLVEGLPLIFSCTAPDPEVPLLGNLLLTSNHFPLSHRRS